VNPAYAQIVAEHLAGTQLTARGSPLMLTVLQVFWTLRPRRKLPRHVAMIS
jgi:hypothetical protein